METSYRTEQIRQILEMNGEDSTRASDLSVALNETQARVSASLRKMEKHGLVVRYSHGQTGWSWMDAGAHRSLQAKIAARKAQG